MKIFFSFFLLLLLGATTFGQEDFSAGRDASRAAHEDRDFLRGDLADGRIPYLYEGELEDVGPQFLLLTEPPPHQWLRVILDSQWFYSSNPTLTGSADRIDADVWVNTIDLELRTPSVESFGGNLYWSGGGWAQSYHYGTLSGSGQRVGGLKLSDFNFTALTLFAAANYERGPWFGDFGIRWTRLSNTSGDDGFYREWVPNWRVGHRFFLGTKDLLTLRYDGSYHGTTTETFAFIRDDLNDRWSHGLSAIWTRQLVPDWYLQPYAAVVHETYTKGESRRDWTYMAGGSLIRQFGAHFSARVFLAYQERDSSRSEIVDYTQWTSGLGGLIALRF